MLTFEAILKKFGDKGEKSGWTYIEISEAQAQQLKPGNKKSFRVKGKFDNYELKQTALLPMGDGNFIIPVNSDMRKALGKRQGATIKISIQPDDSPIVLSSDFLLCLEDEPRALKYFQSLPPSHQKYYSKWIESAKTENTKAKRITQALNSLVKELGYAEMMREAKKEKSF